ncbi:MAG: hypothetical protein A2W00_15175 [Candidatus Eisenbacteria bacterium RBG_16_71_46]|nr:MAG: hypothetical protein A2W00_15175 [Candidatus Eisenbacteria bacterium RBG_16_71_46]
MNRARIPLLALASLVLLAGVAAAAVVQMPLLPDPGPESGAGRLDRRCGTTQPARAELDAAGERVRRWLDASGVRVFGGTLPVALHVIQSGAEGAVGDAQAREQIAALNRDFAGTGLRFELASIDRTEDQALLRMTPGSALERRAKETLAIDPAHRLNLYTCAPAGGFVGWSSFPWSAPEDDAMQGAVIHYGSLPGGFLESYGLGRAATHQVGHYLGLLHTFQGGCGAPGDEVEDTPYEAAPAAGCVRGRDTCPQEGEDPLRNFMDLADGACQNEFTAGQTERVRTVVPALRPRLLVTPVTHEVVRPALGAGAAALPPVRSGLRGASPNPFREQTVLRFTLGRSGRVLLELYNVTGQRVRTLIDAVLPAGEHSALLEAGGLSPGIYYARMSTRVERFSQSIIRVN